MSASTFIFTPDQDLKQKTPAVSLRYWQSQARKLFATREDLHTVEVVRTGRKTDSGFLERGQRTPPNGIAVVIGSTPGKWGRSRRDFLPNK